MICYTSEFSKSALLHQQNSGNVTVGYLALDFSLIIEILVLMMKKTGTACIAIPAQTNVFILFNFKVIDGD